MAGLSPISYQWRKNTLFIPGATNSAFVVTNAQLSDAGSYDVIIKNHFGAVRSAAAFISIADRTPPIISADDSLALTQNSFDFNVVGQPGQLVVVDRSTDLITWQPVATNLLSNTSFFFTDPVAPADTNRFYRLRLP